MRFRDLLPAALLISPVHLAAQTVADSAPTDSTLQIREIQLVRREIFDPNERSWFARIGNGLHFQTRAAVIQREVLLKSGDQYDSALVAESERNLRALGIFRRVEIDSVRTDSGLVLQVLTKDGWSTQLDWRFRSTGGEVAFTIGLIETNLLGTASSAALRYRKDPDRNSTTIGFRRRRLLAGTVGLDFAYENRSDGRLAGIAIEQPFFAQTSPNGFRISAEDDDERVLRFFEGEEFPSDTLTRRFSLVRTSYAWALRGASNGYFRLGVMGQVRREDTLPFASTQPFPEPSQAQSVLFSPGTGPGFSSLTGTPALPGRRMSIWGQPCGSGFRLRPALSGTSGMASGPSWLPGWVLEHQAGSPMSMPLRTASSLLPVWIPERSSSPVLWSHKPAGDISACSMWKVAGSRIRFPVRSSTWAWAVALAPSVVTPSPAIDPSLSPVNTATPSRRISLVWSA